MVFKAFKRAFPYTLPILTGYGFLGLTYGVYMKVSGFPFIFPMLTSMLVYGGSLEFILVELLLSPFAPLATFVMALLVQARHLFYGLSMLDKYKGLGWKKFYMIFALSDETFSVNYAVDVPDDVDRSWFMFFVAVLDQSYWIIAATIGGLLGSLLTFNTDGISFVMTAMFVVIFLEQWMKEKRHVSAYIGLGATALCLAIFGPDSFLLPAMAVIVGLLALLKKPIQRKEAENA